MSSAKGWRKVVNQKGNVWWQYGENKDNPKILPKLWIHLAEQTPYIKKEFGANWEVRAPTRINKKTVYGKSLTFKKKSDAEKFVQKYMRSHPK